MSNMDDRLVGLSPLLICEFDVRVSGISNSSLVLVVPSLMRAGMVQ